ncbi:MAG: tape measure protein [Janthinobacterium lividum]
MIAGEIEIRLLADIARLQRDMDRANRVVGNATAAIGAAARAAAAALASMAAGLGGRELMQMVDGYTKFTAQIKLATTSQQEYARALEDVKRISNTAQNDIQATGVLYARIIASTKALGVSQSQVAKVTETVNLALAAGAAGASEASSAMLQLSQAFGSGVLRGEEFNAVYEAAPELLRVLASSMGIPIGALRKLAEEGKLTSDVLVKAFTDDAVIERLRNNVAQITTFSGALTVLKNNVMEVVGTKAHASGFVDVTTKGILSLSGSVGALTDGLITGAKIGAAYVVAFVLAPALFQATATAVGNLNLQIALARMEMASGTPIAALFARSIDTVGVSAMWASGMLGKLKIATGVLFAGFMGWEIGKYLEEQFVEVKVFAELLTGAVLELWEDIKLGAALAADAVTLGWRKAFEWLTSSLAPMYEGIAAGLRKIGFDEKAGQIDDFAKRVRAAGEAQGTFASRTAEARAEHARNVAAIRQVANAHAAAAMTGAKLTEATASAGAAAGGAAGMTEEQRKALKKATEAAEEFIKAQQREREEIGLDKDQLHMLNAARAAAKAPLEAQRKAIMANALAITQERQALEASEESKKQAVEFEKNYAEAVGMTARLLADRVKDVEAEATRNEELAATYGMTKSAIEALELARLEEQLAQRTTLGLTLEEIETLEKLITAKKRNAAVIGAMEQVDAAKKAQEEWKRAAESIEQSLTDALLRGFESGKSFGKNLVDTLKNMFSTLVLRPVIQGVVQSGMSMGGSAVGMGNVGGSAVGSAGSMLSSIGSAGSLYGAYQSSALGQFMSGMSGSASYASQALGAPMTGAAQAGSTTASGLGAGGATPWLGMAGGGLAAYQMGEKYGAGAGMVAGAGTIAAGGALTGALSGAAGATAMGGATAALAAVPVWGWVAIAALSILGGMQKGPEKNTRLTFGSNNQAGNISINERGNEGKLGQSYIDGYSTGAFGSFGVVSSFWMNAAQPAVQDFIKSVTATDDALAQFMSDTEKAAVKAAVTAQKVVSNSGAEGSDPNGMGGLDKVFGERIKTIFNTLEPGLDSLLAGFKGNSQELGIEATALLQYRTALAQSGETLFGAKVTLQELAALKQPAEAVSTAVARITSQFELTNAVAASLGKTAAEAFGAAGLESLAAREKFVTAAGGFSSLAANAEGFARDFLTDAERNAPVLKMVTEQMQALGFAGVDTRDEFKRVVMGLDLTTDSGVKTYGELMNVAAAFAQVYPVLDTTADAAAKLAEANRPYLDQIAELERSLMSAADQRAADIAGMDASTVALYDHVAALRLEVEARDQAAERAQQVAAEARSLQDQYDQLTMSRAQLLEKERNALDPANRALFDQIKAIEATREAMEKASQSSAEAVSRLQAQRDAEAAAAKAHQDSITNTIEKSREAARALRDFGESLKLGDLSPLSKEAQYGFAKQQLQAANPENMQAAANAFLKAAKDRDAGGLAYAQDFAMVQQLIEGMAILQDLRADTVQSTGSLYGRSRLGLDGSHANGLDYVPFDGYRAEMHRGERVQTAAEARGADATAAAVERLAGVVAQQQASIAQMARDVKRQADGLEMVTNGWDGMRTTVDE